MIQVNRRKLKLAHTNINTQLHHDCIVNHTHERSVLNSLTSPCPLKHLLQGTFVNELLNREFKLSIDTAPNTFFLQATSHLTHRCRIFVEEDALVYYAANIQDMIYILERGYNITAATKQVHT